jgi:elongation factor Ts
MQIASKVIKQLRDKTGAGMMDCKRALEETGGNVDAAIEFLRKKGAAVAQKRADRSAKEGAIVTRVQDGGKVGTVIEVNCETDFVARSETFMSFVHTVAEVIELHRPKDAASVPNLTAKSGEKIADLLNDLLAKVGEKIYVRRFDVFESQNGTVSSYTHLGSKIGVLVELSGAGAAGAVGRDVAMQIAAMNPMVVSRDQVEKVVVERELDIYRAQAKNEGKPPQIVDKIATGRLEKFYQEVCLLEQTYIKDAGKSIGDYLKEAGAMSGGLIEVLRFRRFHLGEENV